jgi:YD repeat-containing protein
MMRARKDCKVGSLVREKGNGVASKYLTNELCGRLQNTTTRLTADRQHDKLGRLLKMANTPQNGLAVNHEYQYNDANQRVRSVQADGSYWLYEYDSLGQVKSGKKYWNDHTPVAGQQFEYGHDDIGNRTHTRTGGDESGANLRQANYTRNLLNQYSSRTVPGYADVLGLTLATYTVTVNDAATHRKGEYFRRELSIGNSSDPVWESVTVKTNGVTGATGNLFVPETPEAFAYDDDGNLTSDGRWDYTWDAENRLIRLVAKNTSPEVGPQQRIEFEYDWRGRRIGKKVWNNVAGTGSPDLDQRFVYDGWNLTAILNSSFSILNSFMWGSDLSGSLQGAGGVGGLVKVYDGATAKHCYPGYDGNGNVTVLVDGDNGQVVANYEYGPFGELLRSTGIVAKNNPFRFSTKYQDGETDFLYYGYRYYNPSKGR